MTGVSPNQVIISQDAPNQIVVRANAVPGGNTRRYVHTQASPDTSWSITHGLGGKPSVTIVDTSDTHVVGDVTYNSETSITVAFTAAFSGYAYLT
jgi:hypothetical protein